MAYEGNIKRHGAASRWGAGRCPASLGSDKTSGGAHGVLRAEVDIVLLLPVDPVGPRALPAETGGKDDRERR